MRRIVSRRLGRIDDVEMSGTGPERGRQIVDMQIDRSGRDSIERVQTALLFRFSARGATE